MAGDYRATVATPSPGYTEQQAHWAPCAALAGGTLAMRAAGKTYLPQFAKETPLRYTERLAHSVLYEAFAQTVKTLSGRPFTKPVTLAQGAPTYYEDYATDVDGAGTDLTVFSRELLRDLLIYGRCHILVEYPETYAMQQQLGRQLTLADVQASGLRSYWVRLSPEEVVGWSGERISGRERLTQLRVRYCTTEADPANPWASVTRHTVVVWGPSEITTYRQDPETQEWVAVGEPSPNTLGEIPLVTIYAQRRGLMTSYPPLEGLAWLNIKHWQNQSDQDQIERMARVPLLFLAGFSAEEMGAVEIGPFKSIANRNPDAKVQIIEPRGDAVRVGTDSLRELMEQMEDMALEPLRKRPGNATATEMSIQAGRNICDLEAYAMLLEVGERQAFEFAARWDGQFQGEAPEVKVNQDYGFTFGDAKELEELRADLQLGVIDRRTYLWERQRRGLYTADMDLDDVLQAADDEAGAGLFGATGAHDHAADGTGNSGNEPDDDEHGAQGDSPADQPAGDQASAERSRGRAR